MKVSNLVPEFYYKESRDFSYVGRLLEIVLNYIKTNVDIVGINISNKEIPYQLIDLFATSVGFEKKHNYINSDLISICSAFSYLLKNKGNKQSIEDSINILLHSQEIEYLPYVEFDNENKQVNVYVPIQLKDTIILEDLFEYILPVGYNYSIRRGSRSRDAYVTYVSYKDNVTPNLMNDYQLAQVSNLGDNIPSDEGITTNIDENAYVNRSMTYTGVVDIYKEEEQNE